MEIIAPILYFSNFVLSAIAVSLAVMLFRHYRQVGWLLLAVAFLSPFIFLVLRLVHGQPLLTYRSFGPVVNGVAELKLRYDIPGFYMLVVAALLLLIRDARRAK
jgi:hypothetical protein